MSYWWAVLATVVLFAVLLWLSEVIDRRKRRKDQSDWKGTRNWYQDSHLENGNYWCICCACGETFIGHKRRVVCKRCAK